MFGLFIKDLMDDLSVSDDHESFKRWLTDNKEYIGLKKQSRKSTNVSFNETIEESMDEDEDEDEEVDACEGSD